MSIKTIKPLDFGGKKLISPEEALKQLAGYTPPEEDSGQESKEGETPPPGSGTIQGNYILMPQTSTYALGVQALRDSYARGECPSQPLFTKNDGSKIVRPFTFEGDLEARVDDFETLKNPDGSERTREERLHLFSRWLDSCCGIAYKAQTTKFKLVHICPELIQIDRGFSEAFLPIDYDSLSGIELDSSKRGVKYGVGLTKAEVLKHPAWLAAVEENKNLLEAYAEIVFRELNKDKAMYLWVRNNTPRDELRALYVGDLASGSYAGGDNLSGDGSFLRVAQETAQQRA